MAEKGRHPRQAIHGRRLLHAWKLQHRDPPYCNKLRPCAKAATMVVRIDPPICHIKRGASEHNSFLCLLFKGCSALSCRKQLRTFPRARQGRIASNQQGVQKRECQPVGLPSGSPACEERADMHTSLRSGGGGNWRRGGCPVFYHPRRPDSCKNSIMREDRDGLLYERARPLPPSIRTSRPYRSCSCPWSSAFESQLKAGQLTLNDSLWRAPLSKLIHFSEAFDSQLLGTHCPQQQPQQHNMLRLMKAWWTHENRVLIFRFSRKSVIACDTGPGTASVPTATAA